MNEAKYRIHFTDNYGTATIECTEEEYHETYENIKADPNCDDIWVEKYNPEEGYWEAQLSCGKKGYTYVETQKRIY